MVRHTNGRLFPFFHKNLCVLLFHTKVNEGYSRYNELRLLNNYICSSVYKKLAYLQLHFVYETEVQINLKKY